MSDAPGGLSGAATGTEADAPAAAGRRRASPQLVALVATLALIAVAALLPPLAGMDVRVPSPPLMARWMPRVGPGTVVALAVAVLVAVAGPRVAGRWSWRRLLVAVYLTAVVWATALAAVDGLDGLGAILQGPNEYLGTARAVTDVGAMLHEYVDRIPFSHPDNWPVHVAGHPPGAVLVFVGLVRLGLGSGLAAGSVVLLVGATTPVAVMMLLRRLGAADLARVAAPFLAAAPTAIWMAVSADGLFTAVAAWGLAALGYAATAHRVRGVAGFGVLAGVLLGACVMMSYGLVLLGVLAVAVLVVARRWQPLPWAAGAALAVVGGFALGGFAWWEAYPVLVQRYWDGIASSRPGGYWIWANLAALAVSAGVVLGPVLTTALPRLRQTWRGSGSVRVVALLVTAAAVTIVLADLSQMSRSEVERIWLPFVPWLLVGTSLLPPRWRRLALPCQLVLALAVQHLFHTFW
ncbi:hypothetical protein [Ruania halotolerans]|uniref:hypothetical protein n=1 Tax=Ruania halotolerans TaxID=2897773 RepID=UPI0025B62F7C|nr:hypothetical protein [Ruania halotolerans]